MRNKNNSKGFSNHEMNQIDGAGSSQSQFNSKQKNLQNQSFSNEDKKQSSDSAQQKGKIKNQNWNLEDIQKLFTLYGEYGSSWKIIQVQFTDKSSNSIKNKFYTIVRAFLKILFRQHPHILNKIPHQIPSKAILKFFQARQEFERFKGFGKKLLQSVGYDLESKKFPKVVENYMDEIETLHQLIFPEKASERDPNKKIRGKYTKNTKQKTISTRTQNQIQGQVQMDKGTKIQHKEQVITLPTASALESQPNVAEKQTLDQNFIIISPAYYYSLLGYQFLPIS